MHRSQGFGGFGAGGGGGGPRSESFTLLAGEPASKDILDGVETTWARFPGGAGIARLADEAVTRLDLDHPEASVPALLAIRKQVSQLDPDPVVIEKRRQLDRAIQACLGLVVRTTVPRADVVPGEKIALHHEAAVAAGIPVRWISVRYGLTDQTLDSPIDLAAGRTATRDGVQTIPAATPLTQPFWLRDDHSTGMFHVPAGEPEYRPENPPVFPVTHRFQVGDQSLELLDRAVPSETSAAGQPSRELGVIAPVSLRFLSDVRLFAPGSERGVDVEITAARDDVSGTLGLGTPDGWKAAPESQPFRLKSAGDRKTLSFTVKAPAQAGAAVFTARAHVGTATWTSERVTLEHEHIPVQLLQPPARLKALALDLKIKGKHVGYIPGAGDRVAESLAEMGYQVSRLEGADLTPEKLRGLDAVVIGVRAFNVRKDLEGHLQALFDYVQDGGTVVAQYNRPGGGRSARLAPYSLTLSNQRVTDEAAPVKFLVPDHPALNVPNKITAADMEGWVQERGIYFPSEWDRAHFTPIVASGDPGEVPLEGGLLVAKHGRGHFVYTGLVFFRQLPAGVPGAYRLFANLVALGQ